MAYSASIQRAPARFADRARATAAASSFDLRRLPADYYANPYPYYHALRDTAPVHRLPDGGYFLSSYAACVAAYKDATAFSSDKTREFKPKYGDGPLYEHHTTSLVFNDPPLHTRVRRIITGAFTPRTIADMEEPVVRLVDGLLDRIAANGSADLIADLAAAVPVEVIGNLLAVPREERGPLRDWSLAILGALEPVLTPEQRERGERAVAAFLDYLRTLVAGRRARLGDPDRDVLTRLIQGEEGGERLSERELLHNIVFILNAGHETTTNLVGNGLYALLEWPEERALPVDPCGAGIGRFASRLALLRPGAALNATPLRPRQPWRSRAGRGRAADGAVAPAGRPSASAARSMADRQLAARRRSENPAAAARRWASDNRSSQGPGGPWVLWISSAVCSCPITPRATPYRRPRAQRPLLVDVCRPIVRAGSMHRQIIGPASYPIPISEDGSAMADFGTSGVAPAQA